MPVTFIVSRAMLQTIKGADHGLRSFHTKAQSHPQKTLLTHAKFPSHYLELSVLKKSGLQSSKQKGNY